MNVLGTPFTSDWGNFQNWLNSGDGWMFYGAILLAIVVILFYVEWVLVRRRRWRVGGEPRDGEISPRDGESENEPR